MQSRRGCHWRGKTAKSRQIKSGPNRDLCRPTIERPQCRPMGFSMKHVRLFSVAILLVASLCPAFAAEPVFPAGARVGMVPLVGLVRASNFVGFETEDGSVRVLVAELPPEAYGEVVTTLKAAPAGAPGPKPESIETAAGPAYYTVET